MNDQEIRESTDTAQLRFKRGTRKQLIGKVDGYYRGIKDLPAEQIKEFDIKRQITTLENYREYYKKIQERLIELLVEQDHEGRLAW